MPTKKRRGTGIRDDTILHLLDTWMFDAHGRGIRGDALDREVRQLDPFTEEMGDAFEDADSLAKRLAEYKAYYGDDGTTKLVGEILALWRSIE